MQLNTLNRNFSSSLPGEVSSAKIEANAKAFQILSSNLYQDKPLAIVRELSANALDAHKAGNTLDKPFEITLPTALRNDFHIRDYGIGLSHEGVMDLYMTYFGSSKTATNELIGGLGLGSKTPYAYTDTFSVVSHYAGKRRTYTAFKNDTGLPQIALLNEEDTPDEHNGLEIIVPIRIGDRSEFRDAAQRALSYFPKGSFKITNSDVIVPEIEYTQEYEKFAIRKRIDWRSTNEHRLVMGPIAYKIDWSALPAAFNEKFKGLRSVESMDIFASIGDVDIQASREALSYDRASIDKLSQLFDEITKFMTTDALNIIDNEPTLYEKYERALEIQNTWQLAHVKTRIEDYVKQLTYHAVSTKDTDRLIGYVDNWQRLKPSISWRTSLQANLLWTYTRSKPHIIFIELDKSGAAYIEVLKHNQDVFREACVFVYRQGTKICRDIGTNNASTMTIRDYIETYTPFGGNIIKYTELDIPPRKLKTKNGTLAKAPGSVVVKNKITDNQGSRWDWEEEKIEDLNKLDPTTHLWTPVKNRYFDYEKDAKKAASRVRIMCDFKLFTQKLIGIPRSEKRLDKVCKARFVSLEDYSEQKLIEFFTDKSVNKLFELSHIWHHLFNEVYFSDKRGSVGDFLWGNQTLLTTAKNYTQLADGLFYTYIQEWQDLLKSIHDMQKNIKKRFNIEIEIYGFYHALQQYKAKTTGCYPAAWQLNDANARKVAKEHYLVKYWPEMLRTFLFFERECKNYYRPRFNLHQDTFTVLVKALDTPRPKQ